MATKRQIEDIDIKTSHNIVLSFPLAGLGQRIGAYLIDLTLLYIVTMVVVLTTSDSVVMYLFIIPLWMCYQLACELFFNGQSIGKRFLKLRVVSVQGSYLDIRSILIRWAFRIIDILVSSGFFAIFMVLSSSRNQRLGDVLARTVVISLNQTQHHTLKSISAIDDLDHKITYPQVVSYNDQDMLIVKETLQRLYRTPSHEEITFAKKLAAKIDKDLDITRRPTSLKLYFKTLVNDYVMSSR